MGRRPSAATLDPPRQAPPFHPAAGTLEFTMQPFYRYAGIAASIILIAFGIGASVMGINGRAEVRNTIAREQLVGTPDMNAAIANKAVETGAQAKLFAA